MIPRFHILRIGVFQLLRPAHDRREHGCRALLDFNADMGSPYVP